MDRDRGYVETQEVPMACWREKKRRMGEDGTGSVGKCLLIKGKEDLRANDGLPMT